MEIIIKLFGVYSIRFFFLKRNLHVRTVECCLVGAELDHIHRRQLSVRQATMITGADLESLHVFKRERSSYLARSNGLPV